MTKLLENVIVPSRAFNMTYIVLDVLFLAFIITLLILKKRFLTLIWSCFGGLIYLGVDFGLFYCATNTRLVTINGTPLDAFGHFLFLLWFSFSYAVPNFIYIWMAYRKDKYFWPFTILIIGWWLLVPSLSKIGNMPSLQDTFFSYIITTSRQTGNFHWIMGAFLVVGYGAFIGYTILDKKENLKENIRILALLNLIGITTQLSWELPLLIYGIRPWNEVSVQTCIINSLIETNSGMVYFMLIFKLVNKHFSEDLKTKVNKEDKIVIFPKIEEEIRLAAR